MREVDGGETVDSVDYGEEEDVFVGFGTGGDEAEAAD